MAYDIFYVNILRHQGVLFFTRNSRRFRKVPKVLVVLLKMGYAWKQRKIRHLIPACSTHPGSAKQQKSSHPSLKAKKNACFSLRDCFPFSCCSALALPGNSGFQGRSTPLCRFLISSHLFHLPLILFFSDSSLAC